LRNGHLPAFGRTNQKGVSEKRNRQRMRQKRVFRLSERGRLEREGN